MRITSSLIAVSMLVAGSCASTDYGVREAGTAPTDKSTAEASFWYQMDKFEKELKSSGKVVKDAALQTYVESITCNVSKDFCEDLRVYIVREPSFNASMAPNGMMLVNTGLLLRAQDESQLAAVLSHEFVHFEENHLLERYAASKNANRGAAVFGSLGVYGLVPLLMVANNAAGFSQGQESEADVKGLQYLVDAGYNPGSAAELWTNLSSEFSASDDKFKKKRSTSNGWLASHPHIPTRVAQLTQAAAAHDAVDVDPSAYRAVIRPHMEDWLTDEVVKQDAGSTLVLLNRLSKLGEDKGLLDYAEGRVLTLRGDVGDADVAVSAFKSAAKQADVPALAHRYLGEHYKETGDTSSAIAAFTAYLEAAPDARDAALVAKMITDLGS